jgi:HK97 family phage major capsid protein
MKTIAQSIIEKTAELAQLRTELQAFVAKSEAGEDVAALVDDLTVKAEKAEEELARLQRVEKALGQRARPLEGGEGGAGGAAGGAGGGAPAIVRGGLKYTKDSPAGLLMARMCIARTMAHLEKVPLADMVARMFPDDKAAVAIAKTATNVADTTTVGWAAELVQSETMGMLTGDLVPISVAAALSARGVRIDFDGAATVKVPSITNSGKALGGAWVGENGVIPVKQGTIGSKILARYKVAVITVLTRELVRSSNPQAQEVIRQMMLTDTANALDGSLLDALPAVPGVRPPGLLNGVVVTAGDITGGTASVIADLKTMYNKLLAANIGARPVLIIGTSTLFGLGLVANALGEFPFAVEVSAGNLRRFPLISSNNVPPGYAIMVDSAYFASAFDTPEIDISESATLTMANADAVAPTQAMDAAGALGTAEQVLPDRGISVAGGVQGAASAGAQAINVFQTWNLAQRLVMPVSWGTTHAGAVQAVNAITW